MKNIVDYIMENLQDRYDELNSMDETDFILFDIYDMLTGNYSRISVYEYNEKYSTHKNQTEHTYTLEVNHKKHTFKLKTKDNNTSRHDIDKVYVELWHYISNNTFTSTGSNKYSFELYDEDSILVDNRYVLQLKS